MRNISAPEPALPGACLHWAVPPYPHRCLHGRLDDIAPIELGRKLYDSLPGQSKRFVELVHVGHSDIPYHDPPRYLREVATFLHEVIVADGPGGGGAQQKSRDAAQVE